MVFYRPKEVRCSHGKRRAEMQTAARKPEKQGGDKKDE